MTQVSRKPLIFADNPLFDGERIDDLEHAANHWDASYVPGYSELRQENEVRESKGRKPIDTARLQWVRISTVRGTDVAGSDEAMVGWMQDGYKACGIDDLTGLGWDMPPTASLAPDGTIRRGDLALFWVSPKRAAYNRKIDKQIRDAAAQRIPQTSNKEIYPVDAERTDQQGSLGELSEIPLPNLKGN